MLATWPRHRALPGIRFAPSGRQPRDLRPAARLL